MQILFMTTMLRGVGVEPVLYADGGCSDSCTSDESRVPTVRESQGILNYICVLSIVLLVLRIKKLVGENYLFCRENSVKMNSAKF